jgi:methyl-accepting chemotaxis protein
MYTKIDETMCKEYYDRLDSAKKRADDAIKIYGSLPHTKEEAELWKEFVPAFNKWFSDHEGYLKMVQDYVKNPSDAMYNKMCAYSLMTMGVSLKKSTELLDKIVDINEQVAKEETNKSNTVTRNSFIQIIIAIIIGILLAAILGYIFVRDINDIINSLLNETRQLINSSIEGRLSVRGNEQNINFEFRDIVKGINNILNAVITPMNVSADYIDRISKGDIPQKITE